MTPMRQGRDRIGQAGASFGRLAIRCGTPARRRAGCSRPCWPLSLSLSVSLSGNALGKAAKRAKANGVRFGRKLKLTVHQRQDAIKRRADGEPLAESPRATRSA
jgi:hypothetical protein